MVTTGVLVYLSGFFIALTLFGKNLSPVIPVACRVIFDKRRAHLIEIRTHDIEAVTFAR